MICLTFIRADSIRKMTNNVFNIYTLFSYAKNIFKDEYPMYYQGLCSVVCVCTFCFLVSSSLLLFVPILKLVQFHKSI